jgi:CRP/FNR family cyclic AMP-dependent transcriptional regulator
MDDARLTSIPLFAELSKPERRAVARVADEVDIREGKRLMNEGENAYEFFVIEDGTAEVMVGDRHVADLGPGDFLGEMGSVSHARRNATVTATSAMNLIVMTARDLRHIEHDMPRVHDRLQTAIEERTAALVG